MIIMHVFHDYANTPMINNDIFPNYDHLEMRKYQNLFDFK